MTPPLLEPACCPLPDPLSRKEQGPAVSAVQLGRQLTALGDGQSLGVRGQSLGPVSGASTSPSFPKRSATPSLSDPTNQGQLLPGASYKSPQTLSWGLSWGLQHKEAFCTSSPEEKKWPLAHRKVTSFPKNTSHSVLSKHEGTKAGTTGFSVCHSSNKRCLPVGQALEFSAKTWASGAHCPAHNPVSQPGVPVPPPTAPTPTPISPGAQAVLTTTLQARWRASVTPGARWARKGPHRPKQFAQGCAGSQLLAEPRLERGGFHPRPWAFLVAGQARPLLADQQRGPRTKRPKEGRSQFSCFIIW